MALPTNLMLLFSSTSLFRSQSTCLNQSRPCLFSAGCWLSRAVAWFGWFGSAQLIHEVACLFCRNFPVSVSTLEVVVAPLIRSFSRLFWLWYFQAMIDGFAFPMLGLIESCREGRNPSSSHPVPVGKFFRFDLQLREIVLFSFPSTRYNSRKGNHFQRLLLCKFILVHFSCTGSCTGHFQYRILYWAFPVQVPVLEMLSTGTCTTITVRFFLKNLIWHFFPFLLSKNRYTLDSTNFFPFP